MDEPNLTNFAFTVAGTLVGASAIIFALVKWFGEILANRYIEKVKHEFEQEIQSHITRLRKSEFLFEKEFEAASAFISLRLQIFPDYRFPDMDSYDACADFASRFEQVEDTLKTYIGIHGAALKNETLKRLKDAKMLASSGKFEVKDEMNSDVTNKGIQYAKEVMTAFEEIEEEFYQAVWFAVLQLTR